MNGPSLPVATTLSAVRLALAGIAPGFVPTMGALHQGHGALISRSAAENPATVVSIFVNPTQFDDPVDFARYPRLLDRDAALAAAHGATLLFVPAVAEVYPPGFATSVEVDGLADRWEAAFRPGHFRAVATVVARLLGLIRPARAYFGEKDFQQLQVVRRLHADLALTGEIVGCPTVRDGDGLACSSRNERLSPEARRSALALPRALQRMAAEAEGNDDAAAVIAAGEANLERAPGLSVDYLVVVDPSTLDPVARVVPGARALVAAEIGGVRLIDNIELVSRKVGEWAS